MMRKKVSDVKGISELASADGRVSSLLCKARECAEMYLLVSKRQKGCDGMGELAMIKEELREAIDDLIKHCKGEEGDSKDVEYDLDSVAYELLELSKN